MIRAGGTTTPVLDLVLRVVLPTLVVGVLLVCAWTLCAAGAGLAHAVDAGQENTRAYHQVP